MPEPTVVLAAVAAGAAVTLGVAGPGLGAGRRAPAPWEKRASPRPPGAGLAGLGRKLPIAPLRAMLHSELRRAGMQESPASVFAVLAGLMLSSAILAAVVTRFFDPPAAGWTAAATVAGVPALAALVLRGAVHRRRDRLTAQLGPLLELLSLELSSGAAPGPALESILRRLDGELAAELQLAVAAAMVPGTPALDQRLIELGDRLQLPALLSLGGVIATSREYGSSLSPGVRALAAELRRARRRQVIAASRRALNRVLIPSAIGVLAPFMAILLYPALTTLARSLH